MITIREFRERRTTAPMTQESLELSFRLFIAQYRQLDEDLTKDEAAAYSNEYRAYSALIGTLRAIEIGEEVGYEYK